MATIVLGAAGAALGGAMGGSVLGLSMATIGRAAGATLGQAIDRRLLGAGSEPVPTPGLDRLRVTGASEGAAVGRVWGRMRVPGQVIWASRFTERRRTTGGGGGKGAPPRPETTELSYSVSLAVALCEGEIADVGRIWADGREVGRDGLNMHVHAGRTDQQPDPTMEAVEGPGAVPAYRGTAYVVFDDLDLGPFGNRVPSFSFEVFRPSEAEAAPGQAPPDIARAVRGVALMPGSGEYSLATEPVQVTPEYGRTRLANVHTAEGKADLLVSLDRLQGELPNCGSVSLIVSWFGDDLRAADCRLRPRVEQGGQEHASLPWRVSGLDRGTAGEVVRQDGAPVYGGTPADAAVVQVIRECRDRGLSPVFYPFILMEQLPDNALPDPWTGGTGQPHLPWRGRITLSRAPGGAGSPDGTAEAEAEVAAFFGSAGPGDFDPGGDTVGYHGPDEWSYRRFILHYAHLCAVAGGVDAFCIGSEMRALTQIRGAGGSFPAVDALRTLAAEVRGILGPAARIGYAADWSEYHGYQPPGTADKLFHLDPLWADPAIDFVGIDNYMPLSDWRDGHDHADAAAGAVHDLEYLRGNVAGGELYDWYYPTPEARAAQRRVPIEDGQGEPWLWRVKDLVGWWSNPHHDRVGGVRAAAPSPWVPQSKPIWFTEYGCPAVDRGTNQPNKFVDPKSSESALPHHSRGHRDELIQQQYLRAVIAHFSDPSRNPVSALTGAPMVDLSRAHVWAWDARPYPAFPRAADVWSDAPNYSLGHWITGRTAGRPLAPLVAELCAAVGLHDVDVSGLHGLVRGYAVAEVASLREVLQPLMLAHGFDVAERDGKLVFRSRTGRIEAELDPGRLVATKETPVPERLRDGAAALDARLQVTALEADGDYAPLSTTAIHPDAEGRGLGSLELPLALTRAEAAGLALRRLAEARAARDTARFALPSSRDDLGAGDVVSLNGAAWRIDRVERNAALEIEATRVSGSLHGAQTPDDTPPPPLLPGTPPVPAEALFLDLPLMRGDEAPHAPHVAVTAEPWPGPVALHSATGEGPFTLDRVLRAPATMGRTLCPLAAAPAGRWDRGPALRVRLVRGALASAGVEELLAGANLAAIGDGTPDGWELFQFAEAVLAGEDTWELSMRLRGQAGSDGIMPGAWPAGSCFVLLDGRPGQVGLPAGARGVARRWRWGPADRPIGNPAWREAAHAFAGNGLRPYPVCHLRASAGADGVQVTWVRRTRIEGDGWDGPEVPLGEEREAYLVRLRVDGALRREAEVASPRFLWDSAMQAQDAAGGGTAEIEIAQISDRYGPGPGRSLALGA